MADYLSTQPYKGTRDFYPDELRLRRELFGRLRHVVEGFGYEEYDGPMLEPFELYAAKTGEEIVNQQLYWMMDRGERKIAVRPEMTPTLARMVAGRLNDLPRPIRWFSIPNLWRYERPQKGRLREHWQLNVDVLGGDPIQADAEILELALDLVGAFGGAEHVVVRVNHRGIVDHLFRQELKLAPEVALSAIKAIDARPKMGEDKYRDVMKGLGLDTRALEQIEAFFQSDLDAVAAAHPCAGVETLRQLFALLKAAGRSQQVVFDPSIMRGMNYYTGTVFEIFDTSPENRRAMFGGGRYDNLIGLFGKEQLSGVGFGMGDVTLRDFLETHGLLPRLGAFVDVFVSLPRDDLKTASDEIARACRAASLHVVTPLAVGGFGVQLKLASRHHARFAVLFGDADWTEGKVLVKNLETQEQLTVPVAEVPARIRGEIQKMNR